MAQAGTTHPIEAVITELRNHGCNPRQSRQDQWESRCPNGARHNRGDKRPSLSVSVGADERALVHCQAGCSPAEVVEALGLKVADLFPPSATNGHEPPRVADRYDYCDAEGTLLFQVERMANKTFRQRRPLPNGDWAWNLKGVESRPLYRLPKVMHAVAEAIPVWVVEGEKDVHALERAGEIATTCPMGAGKWRGEHTAALIGADVNVVADDDEPGRKHAEAVREAIGGLAKSVRLWLPAVGHKDIADHLGAGYTLTNLRPWPTDEIDPANDLTVNWQAADLATIAANGLTRPTPVYLRRTDGLCLLYAGKINTIYGESGGGKTWAAWITVAQAVADGEHVIILDWEDDAVTLLLRLQALGIPTDRAARHVTYYPLGTSPTQDDLAAIDTLIAERGTALLVIDSTGEAMASQGLDQDRDMEAAKWMATLPRRWARLGVCVLLLDHVPKHGDNRQEIGSQRKRAGINGASYELIQVEPFAAGQRGRMTLKVGKDRGGNYPKGTEQASIIVDPSADGTVISVIVEPGSGRAVGLKQVRSLGDYEAAVLEYVLQHGPSVTATALRQGVTGDNHGVDIAAKTLVSRGVLDVQVLGRRTLYTATKGNDITRNEETC